MISSSRAIGWRGFAAVSWRDYRRGPATRGDERPWDAFRFCVPREDGSWSFNAELIGSKLDEKSHADRSGSKNDIIGWEIWDRKTKTVIFADEDGVIPPATRPQPSGSRSVRKP